MSYLYEKAEDKYIKGIRITGYEGEPKQVVLPEKIEGIPVVEVGPHAFKNRVRLEEITLPASLESIASYAFHNCANLHRITMHDRVEFYGDGVIKHCEKLHHIVYLADRGDFTALRQMTQDNDTRLMIDIIQPDGAARLVIPSYLYDFDADDMARAIHHRVEGAGYAYRECITKKAINYADYDAIFTRAIDDDAILAADVAAARLAYPYMLTVESTERYRRYITENDTIVCRHLAETAEAETIRILSDMDLFRPAALRRALEVSRDPRVTAILMEGLARCSGLRDSVESMPSFSLEDF